MSKEFPLVDDAVKKIVKKSRAMPVAFGFNPGTTDEDDEYLAAHVRKKPEMLGKLALHDGAGTKSAFGTFRAVSSEIHLTCMRTIPQLAKKIKRYLKRYKVTLNVVVMDPDGNIIDSDVETLTEWFDEPDDEAADAPAEVEASETAGPDAVETAPDPAADPAELAARLKALQPEVAAAPLDVAARVAQGFAGAVALVKAGRLAEAESAISKLEMVVARLAMLRAAGGGGPKSGEGLPPTAPPQPPQQGDGDRLAKLRLAVGKLREGVEAVPGTAALSARLDAAVAQIDAGETEAAMGALREVQAGLAAAQAAREKWQKAEGIVAPQVAQALSARSVADPDGLRARWTYLAGLAEEGAWDRALAGLPQVVAMLRAPATGSGVAQGTVAFQKSRVLWVGARAKMLEEARKLADAIVAQSADDPDATEIAAAAEDIFGAVGVIDERLQDVLDRITEAPDGPAREGLKREAGQVVAEYRGLLGQGLFALIDDNPFASVSVAARARAALDQVAKTLAA